MRKLKIGLLAMLCIAGLATAGYLVYDGIRKEYQAHVRWCDMIRHGIRDCPKYAEYRARQEVRFEKRRREFDEYRRYYNRGFRDGATAPREPESPATRQKRQCQRLNYKPVECWPLKEIDT